MAGRTHVIEGTDVHFNKPIVVDIFPQTNGSPLKVVDISMEEVKEIVKSCIRIGLDERAIVVLRTPQERWKSKRPTFYGVVTNLYQYKPMNEAYRPLQVMWCANGHTSKHWPEELWVIHPAVSDDYIDGQLESQEL